LHGPGYACVTNGMKPLAGLLFQQNYPAGQGGSQAGAARERTFVVPRQYGQFKGVLHDQLLFEDERGTIRSVYAGNGGVVFTVVRR
jgi:hypothetical protein